MDRHSHTPTDHLQIVQSNPEDPSTLQFCASEEKIVELLKGNGLWSQRDENGSKEIEHSLTTKTRGGPDDSHELKNASNGNGNAEYGQYSIISIMGPQSSGKSTLLNLCFGCKFEVMNSRQGKSQTTTGIWLGSCSKAKELLIMDLEGTDSIQRTKNRSNFERQTSLMALTLSEVLIVNMNTNDIGRAAGMNVETLRGVLEANLRLFSPNTKTLLLFVIRDQSTDETLPGVTPAKELERQIRDVVNKIWNEIEKPETYNKTQLTDMFDMDFFCIPHIIYEAKGFHARIEDLFRRFTDPNHSNYYFRTKYHFKKSVPVEGFCTWTKQIWDAVTTDESLNIPDQQKLLSAYRCEHALQESFEEFQKLCQPIESELQKGEVKNFGQRLNQMISDCIGMYKATARKYDPEISAEKEYSLKEKLETKIQYLFMRQQEHINHKTFAAFEKKLNECLPKHECCEDFRALVNNITNECHAMWLEKINASLINTDNEELKDVEEFWDHTSARIRELTKGAQMEQYNFLQKEFQKVLESNLATHMVRLFRDPTEKIWDNLGVLRIEFHGSVLDSGILKKLQNLMFEKSVEETKVVQLKSSIDTLIIDRCRKFGSEFNKILEKAFDENFKKSNGVPRDWAPGTDIQSIFVQARDNWPPSRPP